MSIIKSYNEEKEKERKEMTVFFIIILFVLPLALVAYYFLGSIN